MTQIRISIQSKGGPGSGNWGHRGIPGKVGGSSPRGAGMSPTSGKAIDAKASDMLSKLAGMDWRKVGRRERVTLKSETIDMLSQETGISQRDVNKIAGAWSYTSNDDSPQVLSIQEAVAEEFNVPLSDWQKGKIEYINAHSDSFGKVKGVVSRDRERTLLRAMYNNTQAELKKAGYKSGDTIALHRGYSITRRKGRGVVGTENYSGNAIESWSVGHDIGKMFADRFISRSMRGIVVSMKVPIEDILSMAGTGFGCAREGEFVVLGSKPGSQVRVTYST